MTTTCTILITAALAVAALPCSASPLLFPPEPRAGLLQDEEEFASLGEPWHDAPAASKSRWFCDALNAFAARGPVTDVYYFFCTVYYTPRESGFTAERGFDMTPETKPGLRGRRYPRDFLRAVRMEGFGRLVEPVDGMNYIKFNGRWGYSSRALGNRNNTLVNRTSAAVHRRNRLFSKGTPLLVLNHAVFKTFGSMRFEAADTGGGLFKNQIDLFWGEDDPLGPGTDIYRPASCPLAVRWIVPVAVK